MRNRRKRKKNLKRQKDHQYRARRNHAMRKFYERFGEYITEHDYDEIVKRIIDGRAEKLYDQDNTISVYSVTFKNILFRCVYDRIEKTIITVLYTNKSDYFTRPENKRTSHSF